MEYSLIFVRATWSNISLLFCTLFLFLFMGQDLNAQIAGDSDCVLYESDDFEVDTGVWIIGGADAERVSSPNTSFGDYCIRMRVNSSFQTTQLDLSEANQLKITFDFYAVSMDFAEHFKLEISNDGGSSFSVLEDWMHNVDFLNTIDYIDVVDIHEDFLSSNVVIRFSCVASDISDEIYIDNIVLETCVINSECNDYIIENQNGLITNSQSAILGIESNGILEAPFDADYNAGDYILLNGGFSVEPQASFHAYIEACYPLETLSLNLVTEWTELFLQLDKEISGMRPTSTARALAYIHLAAYEAAQPGMTNFISNSEHLIGLNIEAPADTNLNWAIAVNECYSLVFHHFIINPPVGMPQKIDRLRQFIESYLSRESNLALEEASKEWGAYVAAQVIAYSKTDLEAESQIYNSQPTSYEPPTAPGYWTYSAEPERALFPYWGEVRSFIISSDETSTIAPPISYSEDPQSAYYQQMIDVYNLSINALNDDGEDLWVAEFWSDDVESLTFGPPTRQFSIANQLIVQQNLTFEQALHLNLKLGFSLNDAAVSTWNDKYEYMVMRPSVYIQSFIDIFYETNLYRLIPWPNPTFPGYPSGHSAFASAAAGVFIDFFGNDIEFTDMSHLGRTEFRGYPRQFSSMEEMAYENAYSRMPLGVHIEMDCTEGLRLGYEVADAINGYNVTVD